VRARLQRGFAVDTGFFYAQDDEYGQRYFVEEEVFFLSYHYHWGREDILEMPSHIRRWHVIRLKTQLEREADEIRKS
jgi:hypothetical protein